MILLKVELLLDFNIWPCSSVVEQYPEKVCVVCAIQTKATTNSILHLPDKI